jgi:ribosomal protein S18 acetylase RimI-like enzyme
LDDCTDIRIRRARPDDARALAALAARLFRETYLHDVPAADLDAFIAGGFSEAKQAAELADAETVTLLVEQAGESVGYAQVRRRPLPASLRWATGTDGGASGGPGAEAELMRLYLDRGCHGRGVAQRVLGMAVQAAGELGARSLWLGVWERNARAVSFYGKSGFRHVGTQEFRVGGELHHDLVMAADLAALSRRTVEGVYRSHSTARGRRPPMPEEKRDIQIDESEDEMPETGGAPCGDIFATPGATFVTDAGDDITGAEQD